MDAAKAEESEVFLQAWMCLITADIQRKAQVFFDAMHGVADEELPVKCVLSPALCLGELVSTVLLRFNARSRTRV